jgi:hypothetical protein
LDPDEAREKEEEDARLTSRHFGSEAERFDTFVEKLPSPT